MVSLDNGGSDKIFQDCGSNKVSDDGGNKVLDEILVDDSSGSNKESIIR